MSFSPREYRRAVVAILTREYGARDVEIINGSGGHAKLRFSYGCRQHTLTLNTHVESPIALELKRKDIASAIGPPPPREARPRRTLEEMTPVMTPTALDTRPPTATLNSEELVNTVALACYPDRAIHRRLLLYVSPTVAERFPGAVGMIQVDHETWQFFPIAGRRPTFGKRLDGYHAVQLSVLDDAEVFGRSPTEAVWVDGALMVHLPVEKRRPKLERESFTRSKKSTEPLPPLASGLLLSTGYQREVIAPTTEVKPLTEMNLPALVSEPSSDEIRRCLEAIRRIETETAYRLVKGKDSGAWAFVSRIE